MRTFVFLAAGHRYALDASSVQAVHQLVRAREVPGGPPWLAGVIDVHGEFVPLVDAVALLAGSGSVERTLGARVLLVDTGEGDGTRARFALAVRHAAPTDASAAASAFATRSSRAATSGEAAGAGHARSGGRTGDDGMAAAATPASAGRPKCAVTHRTACGSRRAG